MRETRYLTVAAVEAIHAEVLSAHGGSAGIRDRGMLESAVAAPQASAFGEPVFSDPVEIAAAYLFYLCLNHPFIDGNKRAALASCLVFLDANDALSDPLAPSRQIDAWEAFVLEIAAGCLSRAEATARLRSPLILA